MALLQDALQNCGLGGGGVLAMQDSIELSKVLLRNDAFTQHTRGGGGLRVQLGPLRAAEAVMLQRKAAFNQRKKGDARLRPRSAAALERSNSLETRRARAAAMGRGLLPIPVEELSVEAESVLRNKGWHPNLAPEQVRKTTHRWTPPHSSLLTTHSSSPPAMTEKT